MDMKSSRISKKLLLSLWIGILAVLVGAGSAGADEDRGELQLEGEHIIRLVLARDDNHTEEWIDPGSSISLPVGTYRVRELVLVGDIAVQGPIALKDIVVTKTTQAVLKAGGPLQQKIDVKRQGCMLVFSYRLTGIGGEVYRPPGRQEQRGRFTVYRGQKVIGQGAFEYG